MLLLRSFRHVLASATGIMLLSLFCATAQSQSSQNVKVSPSDYDAASQAQIVWRHARPAHTPRAQKASATTLSHRAPSGSASALALAAPDSGGPRYPADLEYLGGAAVVSMENHLIFLHPNGGCTIADCWGDPRGFLRDYGKSDMIHITDQYVGSTANNRYRVAEESTNVNYVPPAKPFTDADMLALVHAVVVSRAEDDEFATGYRHEYHVFLPPGQDECFDSTFKVCYSPDNLASFFFCAYHGSVDFNDIGHVLYSVEPYVNVPGCAVRPGTPNGQLVDSTNNTLSHEVTETITDPDGSAWINILDNGIFGEEIGDECSFITSVLTPPVYFDPSDVTLNGKSYAIQPEYNNAAHACTTGP